MRTDKRDTAAYHNAFLNGGTGGVHRIFDARLLLFHLHFGCCTDVNHGDTTGEFREAFLQFLPVIVRSGVFNLPANLLDAALNSFG